MKSGLTRVLFAGGGTGGHVYMAIAIARELEKRHPATRLMFAGTAEGIESQIVPGQGYELKKIRIGGLKNVGLKTALGTLLQLPFALAQSVRIVRSFTPEVTVGLGGYSSGPLVLVSRMLNVPPLLIEPNVQPGLTNRLLARLAKGVAVAFEETAAWFGTKARLTGIPIRREFFDLADREDQPLTVLVFGGSRGSVPINSLMIEALPILAARNLRIIHQTGSVDHKRVADAYVQQGYVAEVAEYIEDMPSCFARADLVISRAGASTIAEMTAAGKPSILIPFPHAADDHQRKNAKVLQSRGAAEMLDQLSSSGSFLAQRILELTDQPGRLASMASAARKLAQPDATNNIISFMEEIAS